MKRWKLIVILFVAALAGTVAVIFLTRPREPSWHGKTLTEWLEDFHNEKYISLLHYEGEERTAIAAMGTNAVPFLIRRVEAREGTLKAKLIGVMNGQKLTRAHFKTPNENHMDAWVGFVFLGTNGLPAVPKLIKLMHSTDTNVCICAGRCCSGIGFPNHSQLLGTLEDCLKSPDADLRRGAAEYLHKYLPKEAKQLEISEMFPDLKPAEINGGVTNTAAGQQ